MNINLTSYGQGIPVVFLHGWGFDQHIWHPLIPQLSTQYQMILVDLPGFGLSSIMDWSDFKKQLLAQLPQQFALVGWSLGGLFAQRLAIEEPMRVSSLMGITSSPRFIADHSWPAVPKEILSTFYNNLSLDIEGTLKDFIRLQLKNKTAPLHLGRTPSQAGLESGLTVLDTWDLRDALTRVSMPTSFVFGRLDPIMPVRVMDAMKQLYPQFNYTYFRRSAHMPFLSDKDAFVAHFLEFIQ
jgi:pimeloyl-[acyl-carrier protein] methyl ester esterase